MRGQIDSNRLINVAPVRVGEHDWPFVRVDVHLGELASVSVIPIPL